MDMRANSVTPIAGTSSTIGMLFLASLVMIGTAQAQNAATTSSRASMSGIQSVIVHTRDSLQRQLRALRLRSQPQQLPAANPPPH